ncbi:MAG: HD domain-containing protein [Bacteriovoracales bacterium]|nr:HD domain-containing protein [Bacteriovoracales bacterium]
MEDNTYGDPYFSISPGMIPLGIPLPYSLFINSSKREGKNRYVRVTDKGKAVGPDDLKKLEHKYLRLYIPESSRDDFIKTILRFHHIGPHQKMDMVKNRTMAHLKALFDKDREFNTTILKETIVNCHKSVGNMVDILQEQELMSLPGLIAKLGLHDFYTYDHSINVGMYCIAILKALDGKANREELTHCGLGGLLHDLGKTQISTSIINKQGKLTDDEFEQIKKHPGLGIDMIEETQDHPHPIDLDILKRVVGEHHENVDGSGYPNKIKKEDIHLYARICALADFFDAITTKRSYNEVLSMPKAIETIAYTVGKKIDPEVFSVFHEMIQKSQRKGEGKSPKCFRLDDSFDSERPFSQLPLRPTLSPPPYFQNFGKVVIKRIF